MQQDIDTLRAEHAAYKAAYESIYTIIELALEEKARGYSHSSRQLLEKFMFAAEKGPAVYQKTLKEYNKPNGA